MTTIAGLTGGVIDVDNHYYEPADAFSRHIDPDCRDLALVAKGPVPQRVWTVGEHQCLSFTVPGVPVDHVPPPGFSAGIFDSTSELEMDSFIGEGAAFENTAERPEYRDRSARLTVMDEQGLEAIVQLPSLGVIFDYELRDHPKALCANYRAFNRWLEEDWGYGEDGRIYGVPALSLSDLDWAVEELERVSDLGARFVWLSHRPVNGRSPADPSFDPFWARMQERGVKFIFHTGYEGYTHLYGELWGEDSGRPLPQWSCFQHYIGHGARPIMDSLAALILHNLFGRFPGLEVISIENGSSWIPFLLSQLDKAYKVGARGIQLGGELTDLPSAIFRRHVHVNPFHEEDIVSLIDTMGSDRVLFGSDWPHPEGLATPLGRAQETAEKISPGDFQKFMHDNAACLLGKG